MLPWGHRYRLPEERGEQVQVSGQTMVPGAIGYVYWPAVAVLAPFTMIGAPLGTQLSHGLPSSRLKKLFAAFLLVLGWRLLAGVPQLF